MCFDSNLLCDCANLWRLPKIEGGFWLATALGFFQGVYDGGDADYVFRYGSINHDRKSCS